jgi:threonine dehydratase
MPAPTPKQKIEQVKMFGGDFIDITLTGDTFDDAYDAAKKDSDSTKKAFIHPFDDPKIIEGQATVGLEIIEECKEHIDYVFVAIGGGGLSSGLSSVFKVLSPKTKIIGVEPLGAPAMKTAVDNKEIQTLDSIDKFIDGASVKRIGNLNYEICKTLLHDIILVHEGKVCQTILDLYNKEAIVAEPAGALSIAALNDYAEVIKGKNVVCIVSGSNNDISRMAEIKERAMLYNKLKHYFIVKFPQRAGALKQFVAEILGPTDDITHFQYTKRTSKETGPAVVGIEIENPQHLEPLIKRMKDHHFFGEYLNDKPNLFEFLT